MTRYVRIMAALPGNCEQVAERSGLTSRGARATLRTLWGQKILHPGGTEKTSRGAARTIWIADEGDMHPSLRLAKPPRPRAAQIAFAVLWKCLDDGGSVEECVERTGLSRSTVYRLLKAARAANLVRVSAWTLGGHSRWVAVWSLGNGRNAPKPPAMDARARWQRWRELFGARKLLRLGAANDSQREAA